MLPQTNDGLGYWSIFSAPVTTTTDMMPPSTTDMVLPGLTNLSQNKMTSILQLAFSNSFSWMKIVVFRCTEIRSQRVQWPICKHWFYYSSDKSLSGAMISGLLMHISVTWPQWVNHISAKTIIITYFSQHIVLHLFWQQPFYWQFDRGPYIKEL